MFFDSNCVINTKSLPYWSNDSYINWLKLILYYFNSKCRDSTKPKFITKLLLLEEVKRCESILLFTV